MGGFWLTALTFVPLLGAFGVLMQSDEESIWRSAFVFSLIPLAISLYLFAVFDPHQASYQFVERYSWIPQFGISYHMGMDGISLFLVILTTLLISLSLLYSGGGDIETRPREFCFMMLVLETGLIGALLAIDLFLFYVFWEVMLVPMYLMIGIWGHGRKIYATFKFVLFTMLGSLLMLVAILYLVGAARAQLGHLTFDLPDLYRVPLSQAEARWLFAGFAIAFAIKVPMWPVHTWLPDAHVEAPTGGSVILAAIMLKMGGYGFLRLSLPIAPDASRELSWLIIALSLIAVVYIGFVALAQKDMKKLIAYSSIAHMGFVTLGAFVGYKIFAHTGSQTGIGMALDGSMVQMISHGLISGALFLCVGVMYDRVHSRDIDAYGGVVNTMPIFASFMVLFALANAGLPGTSGFVGEFLVILASFKGNVWYAFFAAVTLILGAAYTLWLVKRVIFGPIANDKVAALKDVDGREFLVLGLLAAAVLLVGLWPAPLLDAMHASTQHLTQQLLVSKLVP